MSLGNDRIVRSKFRNYLISRCGLTYGTACVYISAINKLSKTLQEAGIIDNSIYEIKNVHYLLDLKTKLATSELFKIINKNDSGHLTVGLRHYYDFMAASCESDHNRHHNTRVPFQREAKFVDKSGQMNQLSLQRQLYSEFKRFLASCKERYGQCCTTNLNVGAREAFDELAMIGFDKGEVVKKFVDTHFEITANTADRLAQKDFRKQCLFGIDSLDEDTSIKVYKDIKFEDVRTYLENKYGFKWKQARVNGQNTKAVVSYRFGIKLKSVSSNARRS